MAWEIVKRPGPKLRPFLTLTSARATLSQGALLMLGISEGDSVVIAHDEEKRMLAFGPAPANCKDGVSATERGIVRLHKMLLDAGVQAGRRFTMTKAEPFKVGGLTFTTQVKYELDPDALVEIGFASIKAPARALRKHPRHFVVEIDAETAASPDLLSIVGRAAAKAAVEEDEARLVELADAILPPAEEAAPQTDDKDPEIQPPAASGAPEPEATETDPPKPEPKKRANGSPKKKARGTEPGPNKPAVQSEPALAENPKPTLGEPTKVTLPEKTVIAAVKALANGSDTDVVAMDLRISRGAVLGIGQMFEKTITWVLDGGRIDYARSVREKVEGGKVLVPIVKEDKVA